jgi:hypothetical protein
VTILFWIVVAALFFIGMGIADSLHYQRSLRDSFTSPDPKSYALLQTYGFQVKYSPLVELGTVLLIKGSSILDPDYAVFSGAGDWEDDWQNFLDLEED